MPNKTRSNLTVWNSSRINKVLSTTIVIYAIEIGKGYQCFKENTLVYDHLNDAILHAKSDRLCVNHTMKDLVSIKETGRFLSVFNILFYFNAMCLNENLHAYESNALNLLM